MKIGVDLGGTNIRAALVDGIDVLDIKSIPCPSESPCEEVLQALKQLIASVFTPEVTSIGLGVPSVVDVETGVVYDVVNIKSWKEVHLKDYLEDAFGVPVHVNNDANVFALGESIIRATDNLVGIALGTGVGAGIVLSGNLHVGVNACAGEIGCIQYKDSDYEAYCSGRFFKHLGLNGKISAEKARQGDPESIAIWKEFGHNVGELLKMVVFAYAPEYIVIGGGISSSNDLYKDAMMETLSDFPYSNCIERIRIEFTNNNLAPVIGAANLK